MRVALVVPYLELGGVETFLFRLARFLLRQQCEVALVVTETEGRWYGRAKGLGIPTECCLLRESFSPRAHAARVGAFLAKADYDVCLINHARLAQAALGMLPARTAIIPVLHNDAQSIYTIDCANSSTWNVAVAVSKRVLQQAQAMAGTKPVVYIPHGVEVPRPGANAALKEGEPLRLVFVGRLEHAQKGVLLIPEILRMCLNRGVDLALTVVGAGSDQERLQQKAAELGVLERIRLAGPLEPEAVCQEMLKASVLLMPSFCEGLPVALLEAMACGCVPVVSRLPGITDTVITQGVSGWLKEPGRAEGFAEAIEGLYRNPSECLAMRQAARERIQSSFSVETMGQAYLLLMREVLEGKYAVAPSARNQAAINGSLLSWEDALPNRVLPVWLRGKTRMKTRVKRWLGR